MDSLAQQTAQQQTVVNKQVQSSKKIAIKISRFNLDEEWRFVYDCHSQPSHQLTFDQGVQINIYPNFSGLCTRTNRSHLAVFCIDRNAIGCYDFVRIEFSREYQRFIFPLRSCQDKFWCFFWTKTGQNKHIFSKKCYQNIFCTLLVLTNIEFHKHEMLIYRLKIVEVTKMISIG